MGKGVRKPVDQPYSMCPALGRSCRESVRLETGRVEFYSPPSGGFVPIGWYVGRSA